MENENEGTVQIRPNGSGTQPTEAVDLQNDLDLGPMEAADPNRASDW